MHPYACAGFDLVDRGGRHKGEGRVADRSLLRAHIREIYLPQGNK